MRTWLALGAVAVAILAAALATDLGSGSGRGGGGAAGSTAGPTAPALPHEPLTGEHVSLSSLRGKPVLVDFFASWCGPCNAEAPILRRAAHALAGRARIVAVDWSDSRHYALAFVHRYHWGFPVLFDPNGKAGYAYGLQGLPNAFVIDADGHVVRKLVGPQSVAALVQAVTGSTHA